MTPQELKIQRLKDLFQMVEGSVSKAEFMAAIKDILEFVKGIKQSNSQDWSLIRSDVSLLGSRLKDGNATDVASVKEALLARIEIAIKQQEEGMKFMYDKASSLRSIKGDPGQKGDKGDSIKGDKGNDGSPDTPAQVRDKLESLKESERLDKSAVKGIEEIEQRIENVRNIRVEGRGGGKGFMLYVAGKKKLLTAQTLNFVAGTGMTISYAYANGRNDITFTATGTASLSPIAVTGTIDDSNTSFTAASAPSLVIINGAAYRNGYGVTIVGTAITTDNPIGVGGDIYCL